MRVTAVNEKSRLKKNPNEQRVETKHEKTNTNKNDKIAIDDQGTPVIHGILMVLQ